MTQVAETKEIRVDELKPCPFCGGPMQLRFALWPSEGDRDAVIHNVPGGTSCPIEGAFSIDTFDNGVSVAEAWNRRASDKPSDAAAWQDLSCDEQFVLAQRIAANVGYVLTPEPEIDPLPWECGKCGCRTFVRVDMRQEDGSFAPGPAVRCVSCKNVSMYPMVPARTLTTQPAESAKSGDGVTITEERIERAARAIMERDVCGYCVDGVRCFCDDALVQGELDGYGKPLRQSVCGCKEAAKVALTAALAEPA